MLQLPSFEAVIVALVEAGWYSWRVFHVKKDNLVSTNGWDLRFLVKKDRFRVPLGTHCEVNETETNSCYYVLLSFVLPDVSQSTLF